MWLLRGGGDRHSELRILQATSTTICVVRKSLKTRRRGFDDSSSPSARHPMSGHSFSAPDPRSETRRTAGFSGHLSEPRGPPPRAHFGPFSVSLGPLSPTQPNHGHFGTDVESSIIQWVGGRPKGSGFEKPRSGEVNTDRTVWFSGSATASFRPLYPQQRTRRSAGQKARVDPKRPSEARTTTSPVIQPVIRFTIGDWNLINRTIVPDRVAGAREPRQASAVLDQLGAKRSRARVPVPHPAAYALASNSQIRLVGRRRLAEEASQIR